MSKLLNDDNDSKAINISSNKTYEKHKKENENIENNG